MTKGETTRQEIIQKSAPVFNQRGYAGTSMQDLMTATGLEKGGLYRHFAGKQELAAEAFRYSLKEAFQSRLRHVETLANPVDKLRHMVHAFVERPSPIPGGCPLMNLGVDADDTNPELRSLACRGLQFWKRWIIETVDDGIRSGVIYPKTEAAKIANQLISSLEGALLICRLEKSREALKDAQVMLDLVLAGIEKHSPVER